MANDKKFIIISLDISSDSKHNPDLQSTDGSSSFDISTYEEIVYNSPDIVSSKGPSKSLLKCYEDLNDEYKEESWFSKSGGKNNKAKPSFSTAKAYGSSSLKVKAYRSSSSKAKASPKTLIVKSPVPITNCALRLANAKT
uniref:Uncharacterized protein n=1 Tax=Tanacetum cinerariifolium TaxID=118510 RepID=A0A6L2KL34_TANCI|nr:hypothetical protein [Tanacetum cinerariifolium]